MSTVFFFLRYIYSKNSVTEDITEYIFSVYFALFIADFPLVFKCKLHKCGGKCNVLHF